MLARNAHFNLNRLGAIVDTYADNFYGIDYGAEQVVGLPSDRMSATWNLDSPRVRALASGASGVSDAKPDVSIAIPSEWSALVKQDPQRARDEQARVRAEFKKALGTGLICAGFERGPEHSQYLLFESSKIA